MYYKEFLPSKHLQEIAQDYWLFKVSEKNNLDFPIQHEILPESNASIVLIKQPYYTGTRILGPRTKKFNRSIMPNSIYFGIRLNPWLSIKPNLFDKNKIINKTINASSLITDYLKVDDDLIQYSSSLQLLENKLTLLLNTLEIQKDDLVKFICLELSSGTPIYSILEKVPYSVRVIQKKFKSIVGITMRQFASNAKQRNLWIDLSKNDRNKLDTIFKYNYYDHSHFINDFKRKMKRSASDYENYLKTINISLV